MVRRDIRYQAAIIQEDHILLLRALERDGATFWLPPGGGREGEETAEACVCREVLEETSLIVGIERFLFAVPDMPGGTYDFAHTYLCRVHSGTAQPGVEPEVDTAEHATIQETGWFDLRDPAHWPSLLVMDPITYSWLERLRATLGYA
jgi:8-oxo-dGTP pyrophosphatase MutT (NUDIX family)